MFFSYSDDSVLAHVYSLLRGVVWKCRLITCLIFFNLPTLKVCIENFIIQRSHYYWYDSTVVASFQFLTISLKATSRIPNWPFIQAICGWKHRPFETTICFSTLFQIASCSGFLKNFEFHFQTTYLEMCTDLPPITVSIDWSFSGYADTLNWVPKPHLIYRINKNGGPYSLSHQKKPHQIEKTADPYLDKFNWDLILEKRSVLKIPLVRR